MLSRAWQHRQSHKRKFLSKPKISCTVLVKKRTPNLFVWKRVPKDNPGKIASLQVVPLRILVIRRKTNQISGVWTRFKGSTSKTVGRWLELGKMDSTHSQSSGRIGRKPHRCMGQESAYSTSGNASYRRVRFASEL